MEIDVVLTLGPPDVRDLVSRLEAAGVDGVATVEGPHDVFIPLVQAALGGKLDVASYVAIAFPRSPVHLAHIAWDLRDEDVVGSLDRGDPVDTGRFQSVDEVSDVRWAEGEDDVDLHGADRNRPALPSKRTPGCDSGRR